MLEAHEIRKDTTLRAPIARVWTAITDSQQFGTWFGAEIAGPFVAGQTVRATIRPTRMDEGVAKAQAAFDGTEFEMHIETLDAPHVFEFRWAPGIEPVRVDGELLTTLVRFELSEIDGGTRLRIVESGFDVFPAEARARVFTDNDGGWDAQILLVTKYLAAHGV